jgi:hypothetical protein
VDFVGAVAAHSTVVGSKPVLACPKNVEGYVFLTFAAFRASAHTRPLFPL